MILNWIFVNLFKEKDVESTAPMVAGNWLAMIWAFLNSPTGLLIVGTILAFILGKIFTAKPAWKTLALKYGPSLMSAVKQAEKAIPDGTPNKSLARLDAALKFVIALEPKLAFVNAADVKAAITAVHTQAESNDNL